MDLNELERLVIEQRKELIKYKDSQAKLLLQAYGFLLEEIEYELAKIFKEENVDGAWDWERSRKSEMLESMFLQVESELQRMTAVSEMNLNVAMETTVTMEYAFASYLVAKELGGRVFIPPVIPLSAAQEIIDADWSGDHFSKRLWENQDYTARVLKQETVRGIISGESLPKTVKRVTSRLETEAYKAERLVRTEIMAAANRAHKGYYERFHEEYGSFNLFGGVTILETLDRRTCDRCKALDGKQYSPEEMNQVKDIEHPNCRRALAPRIRGFDKITTRAARDLDGKYVRIEAENYADYAKQYKLPTDYKAKEHEVRQRNAKAQYNRYKERIPDLPSLSVFASQKARDTALYREWQDTFKEVGKRIKQQDKQ